MARVVPALPAMKAYFPGLFWALSTMFALGSGAPASAASSLNPTEARLIQLACHHDVVMLGENSHGDGATIALKAKLIPELVRRCGFSALAFESSYYDFRELTDLTKPGQTYDRSKLQSAVGVLWARDAEFASLAEWLSKQTPRTLRLAGLDDQIGARSAFYSLQAMPADLAAMTPPSDRQPCRETMTGYINYTLDRGQAQKSVARCLDLALAELATKKGATAAKLRSDALAFQRANSWANMSNDDMSAARDQAMADQLRSFRRKLRVGTKVIVWTANGHVAEGGVPVGKTLGQITRERIGPRLFTVASSAAAGEFRWTTTEIRPVPPSMPGQLEYTVLGGRTEAVATRAELRKLGKITGTALSWHKPTTEDWSTLFDAIYVLAREEPTTLTAQ